MAIITLERLKSTDINKYPSNSLKDYYDIIHELMESLTIQQGVKFKGDGAHQELIDYISQQYNLGDSNRIFLQDMRDYRNRTYYEGFIIESTYLERNVKRIELILEKLKYLITGVNAKMIENIIFDWSGTLVNNLESVYEATMMVFKKLGGKRISLDEYKKENVSPYMNFWNKYFPDLTKEQQDVLFKEAIKNAPQAKLYDGVPETLKRLHSKGIKLIVMSSQHQEQLEIEAERYGIKRYIQTFISGVHDKKGVILGVVSQYGLNPVTTLCIGDTVAEVETGKMAKLTTVALTWGFDSRDKLSQAKPDYIFDNLSQLEKIV
jgi:phosphoglycolate phosphatase